ncbi:MAG: thioredoxin family protein [Balneolaceae bacterium]|nr:thioredoxin family protein [Balneolaceae bacterium]MBO6546649.1 thioredoxin family protein [Balneolaceae bacterium]MBO6649007.1 thioredoxin family protein [Balneolaceae bacterium]
MSTTIISPITQDIIDQAYSYSTFNSIVEKLFERDEVTDQNNTESNLNYTKLNIQRSSRWDKRGIILTEVEEMIRNINRSQTWLVITEGWCGDSAQILPFINKMAELNSLITLKVILRNEYPEVMDAFLTDGKSRSIPKVIVLDTETLEVLGDWGPRPLETQKRYLDERGKPEIGAKEAAKNLHIWYARDKGKTSQNEFASVLMQV